STAKAKAIMAESPEPDRDQQQFNVKMTTPAHIQILLRRLEKSTVKFRADAVNELAGCVSDAMSELLYALKWGNQLLRHNAAFVIGQSEPTLEAVEALSQTSKGDMKWWVRCCAVWALGRCHLTGKNSALKALKKALKDPDRGVQVEALGALASLGVKK